MASGHTENYQLNQWSLDDPVQMEEFNEDNRKVEQALTELKNSQLRLIAGSYTGTGLYGEANPITLTFPYKPRLFFMYGGLWSDTFVLAHSNTKDYRGPDMSSESSPMYFTWTDNSVSWYCKNAAESQQNVKDKVYYYFALCE